MLNASIGAVLGVVVASVSLILVGRVNSKEQFRKFNPPTLGDKVAEACKPYRVSDWHVDYQDESLLQVTCYNPNTQQVNVTAVER